MKTIYGAADRSYRDPIISSTFGDKGSNSKSSKFTSITRSSVLAKPKVSAIERLGLSDPDGTHFEEERVAAV